MPPVDWPMWTLWVAGSGLVASALLAITAALVRTGRFVKWVASWVEDVVTTAVRNVAADAVRDHNLSPQQVKEIVTEIVTDKVAPIYAEVRPNGGSSLKDQITRMDERDVRLERMLLDHMRESSLDRADLRHWLEHMDPGRMSQRPGGQGNGRTEPQE